MPRNAAAPRVPSHEGDRTTPGPGLTHLHAGCSLPPMTTVSNPRTPARTFSVPNLLTYARIAAVPAVVACMFGSDILQAGGLWLRWGALAVFIAPAVTEFFERLL